MGRDAKPGASEAYKLLREWLERATKAEIDTLTAAIEGWPDELWKAMALEMIHDARGTIPPEAPRLRSARLRARQSF